MAARTTSDTVNPTTSRLSLFRNRFSNASILSLPPRYSVVDTLVDAAGTDSLHPTEASIEPPRYSLITPPSPLSPNYVVESDFRYSYPIRTKKPWATLYLHSRDTVPGNPQPLQSQPRVPRFWGCDSITGRLELDLDSPQNIHRIKISINGNVVMSSLSEESLQFLAHEYTVWDKSIGEPQQSNSIQNSKNRSDGRFAPGQYTFPFSFPFPSAEFKSAGPSANSIPSFPPLAVGSIQSPLASPTFPLYEYVSQNPEKMTWDHPFTSSPPGVDEVVSQTQAFEHPATSASMPPRVRHSLASPLPQSFMERGIRSHVAYDLSVRIVHGRFRTSSRIATNIFYIPASRPHPASEKRQKAYETGALLPCPMHDPEGWLAWPTLTIYGVINPDASARYTKAECTLYLAQPLSYTRGSVIPCFLTISSDDEELTRLLSSPKAPTLRLLRHIQYRTGEINNPSPTHLQFVTPIMAPGFATAPSPTIMKSVNQHEAGRAQWWIPSKDVIQSPNARHLEGEIRLSATLQPSCDLEAFRVEYSVELMPFRTRNFEPDHYPTSRGKSTEINTVLASNPVEITTLYREDELFPIAYSGPP